MSDGIVKILVGVVGVAIVAVLVSRNAQTANLLNAAGSALEKILKAATGPVSGGNYGVTL